MTRRNIQIQLLQNEFCWSQRKSYALFREGLVKSANKLVKNANKLVKKTNHTNKKSVIVCYNRRFSRHIVSFMGLNIKKSYTELLPNGYSFLNRIEYV